MKATVRKISFIVAVLAFSSLSSLPAAAQSNQKEYQMDKTNRWSGLFGQFGGLIKVDSV